MGTKVPPFDKPPGPSYIISVIQFFVLGRSIIIVIFKRSAEAELHGSELGSAQSALTLDVILSSAQTMCEPQYRLQRSEILSSQLVKMNISCINRNFGRNSARRGGPCINHSQLLLRLSHKARTAADWNDIIRGQDIKIDGEW